MCYRSKYQIGERLLLTGSTQCRCGNMITFQRMESIFVGHIGGSDIFTPVAPHDIRCSVCGAMLIKVTKECLTQPENPLDAWIDDLERRFVRGEQA